MYLFQSLLLFYFVFEIQSKSIQNTTMDEQDILFLKTEVKTLKERLDNLTETVEKGRKHGIPTVMFFVRLTAATTLNKNSIVKFDHVITDTGNDFNPGDGIFVAPMSGIYLFSWTTLAYTSKHVDTELRVDNVVVASSYGYIGTSSNVPVTKVVLYQVKKGDHVWIQTSRYVTENYFNNPYDSRSSFTGMLVVEN
ncbi:complement C1q tumor necrosis factor-related protein 3-like [Mytilus trossulus]|uniref:complement C1q tumor necrosis factor-related protein 3-like n=1 Tax=Mytilus trossulus TaxID=6551 RepID=UPI00300769D8